MEMWYLLLLFSLFVSALLKSISILYFPSKESAHRLPPGPPTFPIIGSLLWLRLSFFNVEHLLRSLHAKFGPIVTIRIMGARQPFIFVADRILAHQALVQQGGRCADRPAASATARVFNSNQSNISASFYGPTWRLLRRNLTAGILHPSRVKTYGHGRKWVLQVLKNRLECQAQYSCRVVSVMENFQHAMFSLLVFVCFGDKLDEEKINKVAEVQRTMLLNASKFNVLNFWPSLTKILLWKSWRTLHQFRQDRDDALVPLIRARMKMKKQNISTKDEAGHEYTVSYVDTLLSLELPDEKRKLNEGEIIILCSELLNAGTDTTSTALQWIMANLVKYPQIQEKLFFEIKGFVGDEEEEEVKTEDLPKMRYLKAVILEGLRRHPPAHFVLPHAVTEDVALDKYVVPKHGIMTFAVADMGWDPKVSDDPMAFKPERFLREGNHDHEEAFDITGSKGIKMMPFGAGRRMCPAYGLAILHLEYFVANLIWNYEWKLADEEDIDLTEKEEFTVVMKNPLRAQIYCRLK